MGNIWKQQKDVNDHPNRNNFDLSKKSNLSMKFGTLYPVYCQPVVPGDSFSIDTAFNLKLMPVIFPVQTKMRAHMHYFYVRNKNLWSNWENWISNLVGQSDHPHPYISVSDDKFKTGSIHDYLGVPTSQVVSNNVNVFSSLIYGADRDKATIRYASGYPVHGATILASTDSTVQLSSTGGVYFCALRSSIPQDEDFSFSLADPTRIWSTFLSDGVETGAVAPAVFSASDLDHFADAVCVYTPDPFNNPVFTISGSTIKFSKNNVDINTNKKFNKIISDVVSEGRVPIIAFYIRNETYGITFEDYVIPNLSGNNTGIVYFSVKKDVDDYSNLGIDLYSRHLHINALPYRAYESVYYTYYNNNVLNPLKIGGVPQYNRYNTELGDGADTTDYHLFQRNYELDFLTSSLPSPQQGVAPVVGMTALGDVTIEDENGITTAHAEIDNDGTITKVVLTSPAASIEHARTAMNLAACGMSISDFRQTNALQRFLETNIRKGYRYMDFIAGHFGKEPEYRELDLPEFIGGFSRDVSVSTVVSNADTLGDDSGKSLGAYGGYAQVLGGGKSSIRHYCDDYGFIIGIMSVVPTPCYSQLLPKYMVAPDNFLDYYFPEFSSSGLQPITFKEVAPIQAYLDSLVDPDKSLEDTFGYQRPNYDLVSSVDEVHGEFRDSLRNYVINRIFDSRPELGQSFISINPSEINDIFVNTNPDDDCIIGEIGFAVHAKRPIPRVVIPNLGK